MQEAPLFLAYKTNFVSEKLSKLEEKNEIRDHFDVPTDDVVKYIMLTTFEVVEAECMKCFFCQNHNRFSIFSQCKIKNHTQKNCFHFRLNTRKVMKNKYYKILIRMSDATRGKYLKHELCPSKTKRNIIYESIRLSESLNDFRQINNISSDI